MLTRFAPAILVLLAGCALPPNTALRDWARTASVTADQPAMVAPSPRGDALLAQQQALAIYFYALGVLAEEERMLTFRADPYDDLARRAAVNDPAAGQAVAQLGALLAIARAGNLPPDARANSANQSTVVEDLRLRRLIRAANAPVDQLLASLSEGVDGPAPEGAEAYRQALTEIRAGQALIHARVSVIGQREVARDLRDAEDRLRRAARLLPPDPLVAARRPPAQGAVAAVVQP